MAAGTREGVVQFRSEHRAGELGADAMAPFPALAAWRGILRSLGVLGFDPARYDGAPYGNISVRLPPYPGSRGRRRFLITGTGTSGALHLRPEDTCVVERYDAAANLVVSTGLATPSSESLTHGALYDLDSSIRCVFHAHAPLPWRLAVELRLPCTRPDVAQGTPEMAEEMARLHGTTDLPRRRVLVMRGHEDGILSFGATAAQAGAAMVATLARARALELARCRPRA